MAINSFPAKGGIPSGNTAARPSSPVIGDTYYNGQLEILEIYNGTIWVAVSAPPSTPQITSVTDASTGDAYTSTAGKLSVVFVAGSGGGTPSQYNAFTVAGGHSANSSSTTVTLTGLTPGTSYEVYGNGQNNFGTTVNSPNQAAVTPTTLPQVPTIGTATASTSANEVTVTWTNGNNGGKNLSAITITPFLNGTTAQTSRTAATTSSTSYTFTEGQITAGSAYTFKVKATNANGTCADSTATNSATMPNLVSIDYLVIAGGGGGSHAGGGGAGGYRTNLGTSGGNSSAEASLGVATSTNYTVTVGGGGAGGQSGTMTKGVNSVFHTITSEGGGGGGYQANGAAGGSGGGSGANNTGGARAGGTATANQGSDGGDYSGSGACGSGGGGAGAAGGDNSGNNAGNGGNGLSSNITGTSVTRGGGGGGSGTGGTIGNAGSGGGGAGGVNTGSTGDANTGGGGGAGWGTTGVAGGSGVVILRYSDTRTITIGAGLTGTESSASGGYKRATITAGSGNVSWA